MVLGQKETTKRRKDTTETETKVENERKQLGGRQEGSARGGPESQGVPSLPAFIPTGVCASVFYAALSLQLAMGTVQPATQPGSPNITAIRTREGHWLHSTWILGERDL